MLVNEPVVALMVLSCAKLKNTPPIHRILLLNLYDGVKMDHFEKVLGSRRLNI